MKAPFFTLSLLVAATTIAGTAQAVTTGNLNFRGQIDGGTCNLAAGDVNRTITLPPQKVSDFDNVAFTGIVEFTLTANCDSDIRNVIFTFAGTPAPADPARFANTGTAAGIALVLQARNGTPSNIPANGTVAQRQRTVSTSAGSAQLPMAAHYYKTGPVSKGTLISTASVAITYN